MVAVRNIFSGTLGSSEVFAFSWCLAGDGTLQDHHASAVSWVDTFFTAPVLSKFSSQMVLSNVRSSVVVATGSAPFEETPVSKTGTGGPNMPYEVAMVVSLVADQGEGVLPTRGRFYLPPPSTAMLTTGGLFAAADITVIADQLKVAFDAVHQPPFAAVSICRPGASPNPISSFNIGNVPDAQRRRRNKLVEVRTKRLVA